MGDTLAASFELRHPLRHVFKNMRLRVVRVVILTALFETGYSGRVLSDFDLCTSLRMVGENPYWKSAAGNWWVPGQSSSCRS